MPASAVSCVVPIDVPCAWTFVREYGNWASLFPGYQRHTVVAPGVSRWTVRGDVGMFTRIVDLEVRIAEETGQQRIRFTVTGLTENVAGEGLFEIAAIDRDSAKLTLSLDIAAGGPLGPAINALLGPRLRTLLDGFATALSQRLTARVAP